MQTLDADLLCRSLQSASVSWVLFLSLTAWPEHDAALEELGAKVLCTDKVRINVEKRDKCIKIDT